VLIVQIKLENIMSDTKVVKKLILMRGVPGSGKSTKAKAIYQKYTSEGINGIILSTDNQFMVDGVYKFDIAKLGWAHSRNRLLAEKAVNDGISVVIIDNTNLSDEERRPYIYLAEANGYEWEIVDSDTEWRMNAEECFKRNTHGVPLNNIKYMLAKLEKDLARKSKEKLG